VSRGPDHTPADRQERAWTPRTAVAASTISADDKVGEPTGRPA
jgi:hypothetical protein